MLDTLIIFPKLSELRKFPGGEILQRYMERSKTLRRAHLREALFAQFNYHSPIHNPQETTKHRMLISTLLSPNPHRNLLQADNALFPIWKKKERKSISGFNTCGTQSITATTFFFFYHTLSLVFAPFLANGKQKQCWMVIGRSGCSRQRE